MARTEQISRKSTGGKAPSTIIDYSLEFDYPSLLCADGAVVNVLVCKIGGHGFNVHRYTSSEQNGRPHWLSLANNEAGRIRVSHQGLSDAIPLPKMVIEMFFNTKD
ncbi:hypothetical protein ACTXT7_009128 [Hymenolepis weldensis]